MFENELYKWSFTTRLNMKRKFDEPEIKMGSDIINLEAYDEMIRFWCLFENVVVNCIKDSISE